MPGIHTFFPPNKNSNFQGSSSFPEEENPKNKIKILLQNNAVSLNFKYYDGYPFLLWQTDDQIILLEGMIYNHAKDKIEIQLKAISQTFSENGDCHHLVEAFVESVDGDFIVEIWYNRKNLLLIFNGYWGRLPLYYYFVDGMIGISREIKSLLASVPEIKINKTSLVEFLYFEFPLGNKTLFENIYRLGPGTMIVVEGEENICELNISKTIDFRFALKEPFSNKSEGIEVLKELFLQSVQSRVQTLESDEFKIAADLSGGFDSRAVLGGIEKFTHDVTYCTQTLNANDQRKWGQALFEVMGSPGKFTTAIPDHSYDIEKLRNFVFQYDCMANFRVGYNSQQVVIALRELVPGIAARFMGFGGVFLRHPLKAFRKSLIYSIEHGYYFYSNTSLPAVCQIVGVYYGDYYRELEDYLKTYPEQTSEGQLKRLYFEYFNLYVNASEDYCRKYLWTVTPFWGSMLMRTLEERIPLEWTGFQYFTQLMKTIDPRLLQVSIYGKNADLQSDLSVAVLETKARLKNWITTFIPAAHYFYKHIEARRNDNGQRQRIEKGIQDTTCPLNQSMLPGDRLKLVRGNVQVLCRYLTLFFYLGEIEKRFDQRIHTV
jgi:Glutamine amidotransferase domain